MTGKELIIYILENNLENEEFSKCFTETPDNFNLIRADKAAAECDVGIATVTAWCTSRFLDYIIINGITYIFKNQKYKDVKAWEEI